ncbi:MAG: hypothetical protein GTO02_00770 [Candidatus Dadabacteria bacterium]|nr:hypothetical protein [Candidatus Dadabacteria bacterium]
MPILANLFYKIIPTELIILASPFAIVGIYLMPYWFVSKKIVYYFPALFMIPVLYTTLIASVMDFLFLPLVYNRLKNGLKLEAILLGLLMILFHGQYALFYLVILLFYMRKFKELAWICAIGVPLQILPITYFSQGYLTFILGIDWIYSFYGLFNFVANQFILRMIVHTVYILTFILLVRSES